MYLCRTKRHQKRLFMKRFWYAATIAITLGWACCSCEGKSNKNENDAPSETELNDDSDTDIAEMETDTYDEEADGDPKIKAASVDHMKMVIDSRGNVVGRYVRTNRTSYTVAVQDDVEIPKIGHKIVIYSAKNGQGVLFTHRTHVNIRTQPKLESPVITQISYDKEKTPETYPCLGKTRGWYKIRVKGAVGYVRHDLVEWDGMDTF